MLNAKFSAFILSVLTASCHALPEKNWEIIEHISNSMLGVPYAFSSSHDLRGPEQGDILSTHSLDCMTYVTLTIALSSNHPKQWLADWLKLRYSGSYDFSGRQHFLSIDLNPTLNNDFELHDASALLPKDLVKTHHAIIHKNSWLANNLLMLCRNYKCTMRDFKEITHHAKLPPQSVDINYIPYHNIIKNNKLNPSLVSNLPRISIVEFVREGWPIGGTAGTHLAFSHLGFLIKKGDLLILRHAKWGDKVRDEDFLKYVQNIQGDPTHLGVHILH